MKRMTALLMAACLTFSLLAGCNSQTNNPSNSTSGGSQAGNTSSDNTAWPTKTIEIITSDSTGTGTDLLARTMQPYLQEELGVTIVVNTISGGGCTLASQALLDSANDGSVMMCQQGAMISTKVWGTVDYDHRDMQIISNIASPGNALLCASKSSGITSFEDLVAKAKANPGAIKTPCATGSSLILTIAAMEQACGFTMAHVDAGGVSERLAAVLEGSIETVMLDYNSMASYIESGDLIPLCFTATGMDVLPDVKTVRELGYDWEQSPAPTGMFFPAGVDEALVKRMDEAIKKVVTNPDFIVEYVATQGGENVLDYQPTDAAFTLWEDTRVGQEAARASLE